MAAEDGTVRAVDATTGVERWRSSDFGGEVLHWASAVAVADGLVYVADVVDALHVLDAQTGEERWSFASDWGVWDQPVVADGTV